MTTAGARPAHQLGASRAGACNLMNPGVTIRNAGWTTPRDHQGTKTNAL